MQRLKEKWTQEVRIILSIFGAGVALMMYFNANVKDPINSIQSDIRIMARDAEHAEKERNELKARQDSSESKLAKYLERLIHLEK